MTVQIKTGNKTIADYLVDGGVKGRSFLHREPTIKGAVYEVLSISPIKTSMIYVDGARDETTNIAASIRYRGTNDAFPIRLCALLEDFEVLE